MVALASLVILIYLLPQALGLPGLDFNLLGALMLAFPISLAIAILRHGLFDIDLVIRRTLVYGSLTVALGLVYFVIVALLQGLVRAITPGAGNSQVAIVISTLAIAAIFTLMRRGIQAWIDRSFYRRHYDAERILQAFSGVVRDEVNLDRLCDHLVGVIEETLQPERTAVWLNQGQERGRVIDEEQ